MIVARQKPIEEIIESISGFERILVLGCNECVTVCEAGGRNEVAVLSSALRMYFMKQGKRLPVDEETLERQCDREYLEELGDRIGLYDAVLSLACGAGVQFMAETFFNTPVIPGVDTFFMGVTEERGVWSERCQGCGRCMLATSGGICPVSRCAKRLFNGPCGGSRDGKCEISKDLDCAWQLIIDRLTRLGRIEEYERLTPIKDWSTDRAGGPRRVLREDLRP